MPMFPHRPALAAILVAVVAVLSFAVLVPASAGSTGQNISAQALKYDGSYQGECWTFVKRVVSEATGRQIGFDYRQGFFDAGAIEVALSDAAPGDIIQIADDNDTSPAADYAGLHTSIILDVLGNGAFRIIDSNSNFDGVVHIRDEYAPRAAAGRYAGLTFHIYRITGGAPTIGSAPTGGSAGGTTTLVPVDVASVKVGDRLVTNTPGDVLRLRSAPNGIIITILANRTSVTVVELAGYANGYRWAQVQTPLGNGYVALEFLAKTATSAPAPTPTPVTTPPTTDASPNSAPAAPSGGRSVNPVRPFRSFVPSLTSDN